MSSRRFVADLKPDPQLRKTVMLAACAAVLIGLVLLMRLPLPVAVRVLLIILWLFTGFRDLGRHSRGTHRVRAIRIQEDEASIVDREGRQSPVRIMSGSVVLPRLAWLRLRCADGLTFGELLRGNAATDKQWRHLQILWRQGAGPFGGGG